MNKISILSLCLLMIPTMLAMTPKTKTHTHQGEHCGECEIIKACHQGDKATIEKLLNEGISVETSNDQGLRLIHKACLANQQDIVALLLERGADIEYIAPGGYSPLVLACQEGLVELVEFLLNNGAEVEGRNMFNIDWMPGGKSEEAQHVMRLFLSDARAQDRTPQPIYMACQQGNTEVVEVLVAHGANIEAPATLGYRPLHLSCYHGHTDLVRYLLSVGANVEAEADEAVKPLHIACEGNRKHIVALLLKYKADKEARSNKGLTPREIALECNYKDIVALLDDMEICTGCDKVTQVKICSGCKEAQYCSLSCQKTDWKNHKALCKANKKQ